MILRRITELARKQDWFAVGVEFLIVVAGILLAFQVTEWAGARSDRVREQQIIEDLLTDLEIDRAQYAVALRTDKVRVDAANASVIGAGLPAIVFDWNRSSSDIDYSFEVSDPAASPALDLDKLWSQVVLGYHPTPSTLTYDTMVGAGDIKVIRDRSIVREVQSYNNNARSVIEQNAKLLSIREKVMYVGAARGLAPYLKMPSKQYFRLVGGDPELAAAIRIMAIFAIYHHGEVRTADDRAEKLQTHLRAYLAE